MTNRNGRVLDLIELTQHVFKASSLGHELSNKIFVRAQNFGFGLSFAEKRQQNESMCYDILSISSRLKEKWVKLWAQVVQQNTHAN